MPKPIRKPRAKLAKPPKDEMDGNVADGPPVAIAEPPPETEELRPPTTPVEALEP